MRQAGDLLIATWTIEALNLQLQQMHHQQTSLSLCMNADASPASSSPSFSSSSSPSSSSSSSSSSSTLSPSPPSSSSSLPSSFQSPLDDHHAAVICCLRAACCVLDCTQILTSIRVRGKYSVGASIHPSFSLFPLSSLTIRSSFLVSHTSFRVVRVLPLRFSCRHIQKNCPSIIISSLCFFPLPLRSFLLFPPSHLPLLCKFSQPVMRVSVSVTLLHFTQAGFIISISSSYLELPLRKPKPFWIWSVSQRVNLLLLLVLVELFLSHLLVGLLVGWLVGWLQARMSLVSSK